MDACALTGALKRNILLSLAEAGMFRIRWSAEVLEETRAAIAQIIDRRGLPDPEGKSRNAIAAMTEAFDDALVRGYGPFRGIAAGLPDPDDAHVLAAALRARADIIVTDNIRHFPAAILSPLGIVAQTTDEFVVNTMALDDALARAALRRMRDRFNRPAKTAATLIADMEQAALHETAARLRPHAAEL